MSDSDDPLRITDKQKLFEILARKRQGQARILNEEEMKVALKRRVRGQDHIVDHVAN